MFRLIKCQENIISFAYLIGETSSELNFINQSDKFWKSKTGLYESM